MYYAWLETSSAKERESPMRTRDFSLTEGPLARSIVLFSLAASMYQTAAMGVSPYDSLSIILSRKTGLPYVGCRIFTDALCVVVCAAFGGVLGIGTLLCAVAVGPIIAFFNRTVSEKLCGMHH